jgi:hypothetical protein
VEPDVNLPVSYLTEQVTLEEAVAENFVDGLPFGFANDDWQRLLGKYQEGDEFWRFKPPNDKAFRVWGIALVRSGQIVSTAITAVD